MSGVNGLAHVILPLPLRSYVGGRTIIEIAAGTVADCIHGLESEFPSLVPRLRDEDGELLASVNLYVNGEDVRHRSGIETSVSSEDEVSIVVAIAGGEDVEPVAHLRRKEVGSRPEDGAGKRAVGMRRCNGHDADGQWSESALP